LYGIIPAWCPALLMYVIIQAYVTTMAATAITISSSVASIGDMAFLDFNMFFVNTFHLLLCRNPRIGYLTYVNLKSAFRINVFVTLLLKM
jgi:hypothetical protein